MKKEADGEAAALRIRAEAHAHIKKIEAEAQAISTKMQADADAEAIKLTAVALYVQRENEAKGILKLREAEVSNQSINQPRHSDMLCAATVRAVIIYL